MPTPKILVVDDNQELLKLLCQLFEDAGYTVISAEKGRAALDLAREHRPALAVIDILLPDMMGYHVADTLKRENQVPVILLTGVFKGGKHAVDAKAKYGVVGYFEKPFEAAKLLAAAAAVVAPGDKPAPPAPADEFDVELDIDVEEERPQDPLELTGVVKVTGENISAVLRARRSPRERSDPEKPPGSGSRPRATR